VPQQVEFGQWKRRKFRKQNSRASGSATSCPVKLINAELPNGESLEHGALAAVVSPYDQIKVCEFVGLILDALKVSEC
jgi:hypothetical protein